MFVTSKRRLLALPVAVALAAVMAPSASAAIGGANPSTTTLLPDLRSATVTNVSATNETTARVCFNKTIASVPTAAGFQVGGYRSTEFVSADSAARVASQQNCADVVWNTNDVDSTQRTILRVAGGTVANLANGFTNLPDSTPLIGSNTRNGTRGHAVAPDLEGVTLNIGARKINYVFDQRIGSAADAAGCYQVTLQNGTTNLSTGVPADVSFSGNVVTATFAPGALGTPGNPAVRATVNLACVTDARNVVPNLAAESAAVPGTGGITADPDLVAVTLASDGSYVDYTFDENIAAINLPGGFFVSDASIAVFAGPAAAPTIVNGNTVRAPTGANQTAHEYFVWGMVVAGAVTGATSGNDNDLQGAPTGGNAGAFAIGFTTAPDALLTTFNNTNGVVSIRLDQRFSTSNLNCIRLVDDAGALIPGTPTIVAGAGGPAGQVVAQAQFTPGQVTGARSVALGQGGDYPGCGGSAFFSSIAWPSVSQVLSPTATAKYTRKNGKIVRRQAKGLTGKAAKTALKAKRAFKRVR